MTFLLLPSFVQTLFAIAVLYAVYYVYWQFTVGASRRAIIRENGCEPVKNTKELNGFPENIIGTKAALENMRALKSGNFLSMNRARLLRNGPMMHIKILFTEIYTTIEPENVKTILATKFNDWSYGPRRTDAFLPLLGNGIFTNEGVAWQHSRELLRPNFTRSLVGDLVTMEHHVQQLMKHIPRDCSTVNLADLFFQLTLDSATEFLFGESTNCLASGQTPKRSVRFAEAFKDAQAEIADQNRFGPLYRLLHSQKKFKQNIKTCHDFVDSFVQKGLEYRKTLDLSKGPPDVKEDERYIFLYEMVKRTADAYQIRSELMNVLLAGRDTTASLLSNVWFILARRPDVWTKLRKEVDEVGSQPPTFQQLKDMKYLRWVLNETLRLYPVVPGNARAAVVDTVLPLGGGEDGQSPLFIPKGQVVQWSLYTIQRRHDIYGEDADDFNPDRWAILRPGWEYLPFNGGPRICVGQQFALTEAGYTTVRLMQEFKAVESRDAREWREDLGLTCTIHQGTLVGLTPA
ncbi:hypothetical protein ACLMJK_004647 [Lecanora helva]